MKMETTKDRKLRIAARAALAAHMLQIIMGLHQVDLDRLFLRRMGVELPALPVIIAAVEIGALLAVDVLLFCGKKSGGRSRILHSVSPVVEIYQIMFIFSHFTETIPTHCILYY